MSDQSVLLNAANIYSSIQNQQKVKTDPTTIQGAHDFQNMVKVQFNKFADMSPEQILMHIRNAQGQQASAASVNNSQATAATGKSSGIVSDTVKSLRQSLRKQETVARKSLVNEASLIEVLTATTEATNNLKTLVELRNKFLEAHEKVMNMSV